MIQMSPEPLISVAMMKSSDVGVTPYFLYLACPSERWSGEDREEKDKDTKRAPESQAAFTEGRRIGLPINHRDFLHSATSYTVETRVNILFPATL